MRTGSMAMAGPPRSSGGRSLRAESIRSFILRFDPGASYPYHNHPGGEELFVLSGSCSIEGAMLEAGDYLYTPPGPKHTRCKPKQDARSCSKFLPVPWLQGLAGEDQLELPVESGGTSSNVRPSG